MKITLKNIKYAAFASEETNCFEASVYIDGKRQGVVTNGGKGGCNFYHPRSLGVMLEVYAETLPPIETQWGAINSSADLLIDGLIEKHLQAKERARLCKGKTVVRFEGQTYQEGEWTCFKRVYSLDFIATIEKQKGRRVVECLNQQEGGIS